jgi:hypothetical protein
MFFALPVYAASQGNSTYDVGASMVSKGFSLFAYSIGDSMIELGTGNQTVNREEVPDMIFNLLTFSVDPYKFDFVREWQNVRLCENYRARRHVL